MRKLRFSMLILLSTMLVFMSSCVKKEKTQVVVNQSAVLNGANFDLKALGELALKYQNPVELEKIVNAPNGINNLDLDEDGQVDYISVTQYGDNTYVGLQFKAELKDGKSELCTIEYDKTSKQMNIQGNTSYYPADAYYVRPFNPIGFYLFAGHPIYRSPYYYGHYGSYYNPYRAVPYGAYSTRTVVRSTGTNTSYKKATRPTTSKVTKPVITNKSKVASANAQKRKSDISKQSTKNGQKLGEQSKTQKQFQKRDASKPVNASGFSNKSKATTPKTPATAKPRSSTASTKTATKKTTTRSSSSYRSSSSRSSSSRSSSSRKCDMNYKENVIAINYGLNTVLDISPIGFTYKQGTDITLPTGSQLGFSAQQLETLIPEAVYYDETGIMVDYVVMIPVLLKAIQEQDAMISELTERINNLEQ